MNDFPHAQPYERSVTELAKRATFASIALGATIVARAFDVAARQWSIDLIRTFSEADHQAQVAMMPRLDDADRLVNVSAFVINGLLVVTAVFFLRWVHRLVRLTELLGTGIPRWKPSQAVWAFFIPFVSFVRPYQILRQVQDALNPEDIEPPAPYVDRDAPSDYRSVTFVTPPPSKPLPRSVLGLWWGCFMLGNVIGRFTNRLDRSSTTLESVVTTYHVDMLLSVLFIVAAALAIGVVRSLTARLEERFRRIRYSPPEALTRQGIALR